MMCFRPRTVLLGVCTMDDVIWGKYSAISPPKWAWRGSFKPKRQNLYIAISPELLIRRTRDLRSEFGPRKALRGWSAITPKQTQHGWRSPFWKSIWRHITNTTLQYAALDISAQSSYVRSYLCFFYLNKVIFVVLDVPPLPLQ